MAGHVWNDGETELEVLTPNADTFNVFMDNLPSYPKTPDDHHFASLLVPKVDARIFVRNLAKAMGVPVEFPPDADLTEVKTDEGVTVLTVDWDDEDKCYTVSGDLRDFTTEEEDLAAYQRRVKTIGTIAGSTVNYWVADLAEHDLDISAQYDPESACFFGYVYSQADVDELKKYLLEKEFLG